MNDSKPTLHLLHAGELTFDAVIEMFKRLTGRDLMPEEVEEARIEWEKAEQD